MVRSRDHPAFSPREARQTTCRTARSPAGENISYQVAMCLGQRCFWAALAGWAKSDSAVKETIRRVTLPT